MFLNWHRDIRMDIFLQSLKDFQLNIPNFLNIFFVIDQSFSYNVQDIITDTDHRDIL